MSIVQKFAAALDTHTTTPPYTTETAWIGSLTPRLRIHDKATAAAAAAVSDTFFFSSHNNWLDNLVAQHAVPYCDINSYKVRERRVRKPYVKPEKVKVDIKFKDSADPASTGYTITTVGDLVRLATDYPYDKNIQYNIDIKSIHNIKAELAQLDTMVGMDELKENVLNQVLFYLQGFHRDGENDYLHTVLYGPPGTGKTEVAKLLGTIYTKLGILKNNSFVKVTRSDLIAGYLGQTAIKTRELIKKNLGGVIFIDEAYSLASTEKRDSFSKEAIDTLCEALSDHRNELMVIIAGYREELQTCFFDQNAGLKSRFSWQFSLEDYSPAELCAILKHKITAANWCLAGGDAGALNETWVKDRMAHFKNNGRDMENLFAKIKIVHSRNIFGSGRPKYTITSSDLDGGYAQFLKYSQMEGSEDTTPAAHIYM